MVLFHIHIRLLMYASYGSFAVFQGAAALSIILSYVCPNQKIYITYGVPENLMTIKFIEIAAAAVFIGLLTAYCVERFAATAMIDTYETTKSYTFISVLILILIIAAIALVSVSFTSPYALSTVVVIAVFIFVFTILLFIYTVYANYKLYKNRITSEMTLSQRYQLSENMRLIQFIKKFFALYFCVNCAVLSAYLLYWLADDLYYTIFFYFIWQMLVFVSAVLIIAVFMGAGALPTVKQILSNLKNRFHKTNAIEDIPRSLPVRTTMGKPMIFQTDEETNVYFTQLEQSWGTLK
uniref:G_PROTEIN_RECEP_F1_2 domain-containing protein n=1 Tax=Panagrellus redivivus TaxID=6233 RepID=A0A7E4ZZC3_PANRE